MKFHEYIGTVTTYSIRPATDERSEFEYRGRWILYKFLWLRRAKLIGDPGNSAFARDKQSVMQAWVKGGPLPVLDSDTQHKKPAPVIKLVNRSDL